METKICCFTGSRPHKLPWRDESDPRCIDLTERLYEEILKAIEDGYRYFLNGMAIGIDQLAMRLLLRVKKELTMTDIFIEAAIPCKNQYRLWNKEQKIEYSRLLAQANKITIISEKYTDTCMMERNRYMVDKSSFIIAVTDGRTGGTMNTVNYARKQDKRIIILQP